MANWQRTGKKSGRPKPVSPLHHRNRPTIGHTTVSPEEAKRMLARYGPQRPAEVRPNDYRVRAVLWFVGLFAEPPASILARLSAATELDP